MRQRLDKAVDHIGYQIYKLDDLAYDDTTDRLDLQRIANDLGYAYKELEEAYEEYLCGMN